MAAASAPAIEAPELKAAKPGAVKRLLRNPSVLIGGAMLVLIALMGLAAPWLSSMNPADINPSNRNKLPGFETTVRDDDGNKVTQVARMGTDSLGRDVYTRVVWGARVSLTVDNQPLNYFNNAARPQQMTWPGPDATDIVTLAFQPLDGSPDVMVSETGTWALLRLLRAPP